MENSEEHIGISSDNIIQNKGSPRRTYSPCGYIVTLMGFLTFANLSCQQISTSISIVNMVNYSVIKSKDYSNRSTLSCAMNIENTTEGKDPKYSREFNWSPEVQGYILGASNVGFAVSQMPGGLLSEMIGAKITITTGIFASSLCHLVAPFASWKSSYFMIAVQLIRGIGQGLQPSPTFDLVANWAPRQDRGVTMSFISAGSSVGAIIGGAATGALCASTLLGGWPSVYYTFGSLGLLLSLIYTLFIFESPKHHPRISDSEREYITKNQETDLSKKRPPTPWCKILTSVPFYAMTAAIFGNFWASTHFVSVHPTFLGTILHFNIQEDGLFTSVPFVLQTALSLISSWISEWLIRNNYLGLNKVRKGFTLLSCLGYSLCVVGIFIAGCNKTVSIVFSILAIGFIGFSNAGCMINPIDLSPNFAGILVGLCSFSACSAGYIVPVVVGNLTELEQTLEQWNKMFFISIAVVMTSGIVFCLFGSAEVQPWNFSSDEDYDDCRTENNRGRELKCYVNPDFQQDVVSHL